MSQLRAETPRLVLDASVAIAALLRLSDEPFTDEADLVLQDYQDGRINLPAPAHLPFEVGHALRRAVLRDRITAGQGEGLFREYLRLDVVHLDDATLLLDSWRLSQRLGCSFYDAPYLVLAEIADCRVVHADGRLRHAIQDRFARALWIEDYPAVREQL